MTTDFEGLGTFYLGRRYDVTARVRGDAPLLLDAKDLTTHAVIIGMTGSGKTGLGIGLLEEAALDRIPVIAVDPKGDLANLALTFPRISGDALAPWIDPQQAQGAGQDVATFADAQAERWRRGLADWGQDEARIARLRATADIAVYTPGSTAGRPLSLLSGFTPPPAAITDDAEAFAERIDTTVTGLLALLGEVSDPVAGREHVFLATLLQHAWREGRTLDLASLIAGIQTPPFAQVGVMPVDTVFPPKDRTAFALRLNNLLASPGFQAWMQGEPLDTATLLHAPDGRPRVSVLSIAHLGDAERMFFVTLLLADIIAWMRAQPGTGSLRALLYIDELFGYMPPVAAPPSKALLLTLLKQARAFGLGVVLSTQNPVDLDYKGLSNTGTWFIGRLQTERDVERVIDGLAGASGSAPFDRGATQRTIAGLGKRVFLRHSVHEPEPVTFETRWVMSYLAGPMTREQLRRLPEAQAGAAGVGARAGAGAMVADAAGPRATAASAAARVSPPAADAAPAAGAAPPVLDPAIAQLWLPPSIALQDTTWRPALLAIADLAWKDARRGVARQARRLVLLPVTADALVIDWQEAEPLALDEDQLAREPLPGGTYDVVPPVLARPGEWRGFARSFTTWATTHAGLDVPMHVELKLVADADETEGAFRARVQLAAREARDAARAALEAKLAPRFVRARDAVVRAEATLAREQADVTQAKTDTAISIGSAVLGALFGRAKLGTGTVGRVGTAARSTARARKQALDVDAAEAKLADARAALDAVEQEARDALDALSVRYASLPDAIETLTLHPKRTGVHVHLMALAWVPHRAGDPTPRIAVRG